MPEVTAQGLERFHFWGNYSVDIILVFASEEDAERALPVLNLVKHPSSRCDACGTWRVPGEWKVNPNNHKILMAWIAEPDIDAVHKQLEQYGADPKKISSCSRSIDCGQPFEVTIPVALPEDPNQLKLL